MTNNNRNRFTLFAATTLSLTLPFFTLPTTAQQQIPTPVQEPSGIRSGSNFYIGGGYNMIGGTKQSKSTQFFALDLSTSWSLGSAPWRAVSSGISSEAFWAINTPTNTTLSMLKFFAPTALTMTNYNAVGTNIWLTGQMIPTVAGGLSYGILPITDPNTGLVYVAGITSMDIYNPVTASWSSQLTSSTGRYFGSAVWDQTRKQILYIGGYATGPSPTQLNPMTVTQFVPTTMKWTQMTTTGTPPNPSADHCSSITEDGKTLIVFGGRTSVTTPAYTGAIYLLDMTTGNWTAGPSQSPRIYSTCTTVGDQFLVWGGGSDVNNTITNVAPLVFDLTLKQWATSYKAPATLTNNPNNNNNNNSGSNGTSSPSSSSPSSSTNMGSIIGGIVGGLAVIAMAIGFFFYRKRQNKHKEAKDRSKIQQQEFGSQHRIVGAAGDDSNRSSSHRDENSNTTISFPMPSPVYNSPHTENRDKLGVVVTGSIIIPNNNHPHDLIPMNYINPHTAPPPPSSPQAITTTSTTMTTMAPQYNSSTKPSPQVVYMFHGSSNDSSSGTVIVSSPQEVAASPGKGRAPQGIVFGGNGGGGGDDYDNNRKEFYDHHDSHSDDKNRLKNPQEGVGSTDYSSKSVQYSS